jgi:hypothetical protein
MPLPEYYERERDEGGIGDLDGPVAPSTGGLNGAAGLLRRQSATATVGLRR